MNSKILFLTCCILFLPFSQGCSKRNDNISYYVQSVIGDVIQLSNGKYVGLIGSRIPKKNEPNFRPYLEENLKGRILNKSVKLQTVLKSKPGDKLWYPQIDLVALYLEENGKRININKELLEKGMAFFSWELFPEAKLYQKLQEEAQAKKVGVWSERDKFEVLYVTRKNWKGLHFPECPLVENLKEKDRIDYYIEWPIMIGGRGLSIYRCKFCAKIAEKKSVTHPSSSK